MKNNLKSCTCGEKAKIFNCPAKDNQQNINLFFIGCSKKCDPARMTFRVKSLEIAAELWNSSIRYLKDKKI